MSRSRATAARNVAVKATENRLTLQILSIRPVIAVILILCISYVAHRATRDGLDPGRRILYGSE